MSSPPNIPEFNLSVSKIAGVLFLALIVVGAFTSVYSVPADSVAVVLRLGKVQGKPRENGLHFRLPYGIDRKFVVPVERQLTLEFGFGSPGATNPFQYVPNPREQALERDMVTGDLNSVDVSWVIQYRISDPENYLFSVRNPELTLRDATESVMRQVVGDRTVDEVLTIGRASVELEARTLLQDLLASYQIGLNIDQIQMKEVNPPQAVRAAFQEVNTAQQQKQTTINQANRQYKSAIPPARGAAERRIAEAEGFALKRINEAEGDAARFNAVFGEFQKAPEVTKRRIYIETMNEVLPQIGRKVFLDEDAQQILPLLQLDGGEKMN